MTHLISKDDIFLFNEGTHLELYNKLGAHLSGAQGEEGVNFAVWAPNAERVSVMGDFNDWSKDGHPLNPRGRSGIWEGFVPNIGTGARYKYFVVSRHGSYAVDKSDPFAFFAETAPQTASIVWSLEYTWGDSEWMATRWRHNALDAPMSIYEVHLGSWMDLSPDPDRKPNYREIAPRLASYVKEMGFTHVEIMPIMEHPFYGSWGYQCTGYFAPSSRYGTPQDLMYLIDHLHQQGIGVLLDWVPSHFTSDEHGLGRFDGTHLFEHADPRQGWHPDWQSYIFNYGRPEVSSFLLNSALFWLEKYHVDGLRVDAVASMLYLDYSRKHDEWIPNEHGGRENLGAIAFLRNLNETVYKKFPDCISVAEDSTAWPMVSRPLYLGGLGFGAKWDMGWMNDTLRYMAESPDLRKYHHNRVTFRSMYAFTENFVLPLSHDEVVHGKRSLLEKMPGDEWQQFANLRVLLGYMWLQPGKKLLFMGGEFGQRREWNHDRFLDWGLTKYPLHAGLQRWVADLNHLQLSEPALHKLDFDASGFQWVDADDAEQSVICFMRHGMESDRPVMAVCNFTPEPRQNYRIGAIRSGRWEEILNSDAEIYGGSGWGNAGGVDSSDVPWHGQPHSVELALPPLSITVFRAPVAPPAPPRRKAPSGRQRAMAAAAGVAAPITIAAPATNAPQAAATQRKKQHGGAKSRQPKKS